ncbi:MAG: nitrous oxide reductase accessory protein NosL [Saprospiraceae bacterium]
MNIKHVVFLLILVSIGVSCKVELSEIKYGADQCHYCKMNIVDKLHAAQYVTKKGKQFKFDAIECMINQLEELDANDIALMGVSDYADAPGTIIDASNATYIISKAIKSPMGANLSALSSKEKAIGLQKEHKGDIYDWNSIKAVLRK